MLKLYENIKTRREALGMSQQLLAEKAGYTSRTSIAKIEAGVVDLPQSKIIRLAEALDTTPGDLMGWGDDTPIPNNENDLSKEELDFLKIYRSASPEKKKALIALLDSR